MSEKIEPSRTIKKIDRRIKNTTITAEGLVVCIYCLAREYLNKALVLEQYENSNSKEVIKAYKTAIDILEKVSKIENDPIFYNQIGIAHLELSKYEFPSEHIVEAENNFSRAFTINPTEIKKQPFFTGQIREKFISAYYLAAINQNRVLESKKSANITYSLSKNKYEEVCNILDPVGKIYNPIVKKINFRVK